MKTKIIEYINFVHKHKKVQLPLNEFIRRTLEEFTLELLYILNNIRHYKDYVEFLVSNKYEILDLLRICIDTNNKLWCYKNKDFDFPEKEEEIKQLILFIDSLSREYIGGYREVVRKRLYGNNNIPNK